MQPPNPAEPAVLCVDDETDLHELLLFNLRAAGFRAEAVATAQAALDALPVLRPAVLVLDLVLPDISGTELCRRLRADPQYRDLGILMLTARGDDYDRVLGFEVGADDYVVKPFNVRELVLRVRALARRIAELREVAVEPAAARVLRYRALELDLVRHRATLDGEPLELRPLELKLLSLFVENPGRTFSRSELLEDVWGIDGDINTRTVDTHVRRLRERLGRRAEAIETVHGVGYRLREH